jgi:hypothetical protein
MAIEADNIEDGVTSILIKELNIPCLEAKACVTFQREGDGQNFSVVPFDSRYPCIYLYYQNGEAIVFLTIGENTLLEIPLDGNGYTDKLDEYELITIIRTIVTEGFEEKIWKVGDKIVKSVARLFLDDSNKPTTIKTSSFYNPFARKVIVTNTYLNYY